MAEMEGRTLVVKSALGADEYIAFTQLAEAKGLSQSALLRILIKEAIIEECRQQEQAKAALLRAASGSDWTFGNR